MMRYTTHATKPNPMPAPCPRCPVTSLVRRRAAPTRALAGSAPDLTCHCPAAAPQPRRPRRPRRRRESPSPRSVHIRWNPSGTTSTSLTLATCLPAMGPSGLTTRRSHPVPNWNAQQSSPATNRVARGTNRISRACSGPAASNLRYSITSTSPAVMTGQPLKRTHSIFSSRSPPAWASSVPTGSTSRSFSNRTRRLRTTTSRPSAPTSSSSAPRRASSRARWRSPD